MNHFGDPGYRYHTLMSQLWGVLALRLANADLLPFDFASYASNIRQFVNELAKNNRLAAKGFGKEELGKEELGKEELGKGTASAVPLSASRDSGFSPQGTLVPASMISQEAPQTENVPAPNEESHLDLNPILAAIDDFESAGEKLDESAARALTSGAIDPKLAATIDHGTMQVERNWLNPDGIPGRPWFKHILYGARYTYAHLELPGLTEAVEKQDWPTAKQQAEILRQALINNTKLVNELNATLNSQTAEAGK
jgi:N-acetylated-alpha-linked acidic dipeptidase